MHIGKNMEKIRKYIYLALGMILCLSVCACGSRETEEAEMTSEEIEKLEEKFEQYEDENDYLGFDIREIEQQIDGFELKDCILISMDQKPEIHPVSHENISESTTWTDLFVGILGIGHHNEDYAQPIYAQGEYRIGEDIPIGTYQIQNEAVWPITDRNSTKRHSYSMKGYGKWTGLIIPYQDMAERCGFQFMQTDGSMKYVRITDAFGEKSYVAVKKGEKPTVTFTEEEKGCIVRLARVLLIPEGE